MTISSSDKVTPPAIAIASITVIRHILKKLEEKGVFTPADVDNLLIDGVEDNANYPSPANKQAASLISQVLADIQQNRNPPSV